MKVLFLLWAFLQTLSAVQDEGTLRTIPQGKLNGFTMTSRLGRSFHGFLKIPYAKPPLGELRFSPPQKADKWEGIRDATTDGDICTQRNIWVKNMFFQSGQEDCLYLNVYTPKMNADDSQLLPVMVWFHGGGWVTGSGNSYFYPPNYLLDKDVVLVGVNYRLGPIGFLSMEDDVLPGNLGLKDQNLALQWVRKNIQHFGGNPDLVTIFGESAGGSSVHYHMLSPMSRGLFHRAISQSGTAFTSWSMALPGANRNNTIKMAQFLNCPEAPTTALVECLRKKPVGDIITQDIKYMEWFFDPMIPFKPNVEKLALKGEAFLPEHPERTIREGRIAQVPWMTGITSGDGALRVAGVYNNNTLVEELDKKFNEIAPFSLFYRGKAQDPNGLTKKIRRFYFGDKAIGNETVSQAVDLWTDAWFLAGAEEAVRLHLKNVQAPVYYYYFSYRGSVSFSSVFGDDTRDYGVCHADDLIYLFPQEKPFPGHKYTEEDVKYIDTFLQLWTDFAKYGDPTPSASQLDYHWDSVQSTKLEYLHLSKDGLKMEQNLLPERSSFWKSLGLSSKMSTAHNSATTDSSRINVNHIVCAILTSIFAYFCFNKFKPSVQ